MIVQILTLSGQLDIPLEVGRSTGAVSNDRLWLDNSLANITVSISDAAVVEGRTAEQASTVLTSSLGRRPQLEVVVIRVFSIENTYHISWTHYCANDSK